MKHVTTPEQSKQLMELEIPANSADCIYTRYSRDEDFKCKFIEQVVSCQLFENTDFYIPCWSASKLMEIIDECTHFSAPAMLLSKQDDAGGHVDYVEALIESIKELRSMKTPFDFSKLQK